MQGKAIVLAKDRTKCTFKLTNAPKPKRRRISTQTLSARMYDLKNPQEMLCVPQVNAMRFAGNSISKSPAKLENA